MVVVWRYFWCFLGSGGVAWGHGCMTQPRGVEDGVGRRRKVGFWANVEDARLHCNHLKRGPGKWLFFGGIFDGYEFWWSPVGSWVDDPTLGVEDGVGWRRKVGFWANAEDVPLHRNHLKRGPGKWIFWGIFDGFWVLVGSWVDDPTPGVEDGVGWCRKIGFCANVEDVRLDLICSLSQSEYSSCS